MKGVRKLHLTWRTVSALSLRLHALNAVVSRLIGFACRSHQMCQFVRSVELKMDFIIIIDSHCDAQIKAYKLNSKLNKQTPCLQSSNFLINLLIAINFEKFPNHWLELVAATRERKRKNKNAWKRERRAVHWFYCCFQSSNNVIITSRSKVILVQTVYLLDFETKRSSQ